MLIAVPILALHTVKKNVANAVNCFECESPALISLSLERDNYRLLVTRYSVKYL